jgi:hypothetical protein
VRAGDVLLKKKGGRANVKKGPGEKEPHARYNKVQLSNYVRRREQEEKFEVDEIV